MQYLKKIMNNKFANIAEISVGELFDKITILDQKSKLKTKELRKKKNLTLSMKH